MGNFLMPIQPRQPITTMPVNARIPRGPEGLMPIQPRAPKPGGQMLMPIDPRMPRLLTPKQQRQVLMLAGTPTQPTPLLDALNQRSIL